MADDHNAGVAIKILNVLVWIFFFGSNVYTALGGPAAGYYSQKETYITPDAGTFWIWTVINVLFLGFVVFQFFPAGIHCVDVIGWRFAGIGILQAIWIHLFIKHHYVVAFIFSLFVAMLVSHVYWDLKNHHAPETWSDIAFIHLPFSFFHSYLIFLVVLSAFTAFGVDASSTPAGVATKALVIIALISLGSTGVGYAFHSEKGDVAGSAVMAVMLGGVFAHVKQPASIHWVALAVFIVNVLAVGKALCFSFRRGGIRLEDPERAPLVA